MEIKGIRRRTLTAVVTTTIATLLLLALCTTSSVAVPTTYFGEDLGLGELIPLSSHPNADAARAAFFAQITNPGTEDLESFADMTSAPIAVNFGAAGTATLQGGGYVSHVPAGTTNGVGRYAISGTKYWETSDVFYIDFTVPQVAFGFYGVDVGDFKGQLLIEYEDGTVETVVVPNTVNSPGGTVIYFGFIDTAKPFTKVTFGNTEPGVDYFGFDDFTIGTMEQVIPEFSTIAIPVVSILGLLFFFNYRKRRREQ